MAAGVRKPPGEETALGERLRCRGYGDLAAADEVGEQWRDAAARWLIVMRLVNGWVAVLNGVDVRAI
jgi:hypothetical protein